jgi:ferredoxin-NADP reductase/predicted pyridoxine 5'-phosphate oxidase superfamily flavin-nucleotide-binding protein
MQTSSDPSPFHAGEQEVQRRLGVRESIEPWARKVVRSSLPEEHRSFYASLPFLVVAMRDTGDRPWVTILAGEPGFASASDPGALAIRAQPVPGDALAGSLVCGADIGILGIELATRRRNRVNGRVEDSGEEGFTLAVDQSFGNCPQYIRERAWRIVEPTAAPARRGHERLTPELARRIREADTLFIATGHRGDGEDPTFGMDASHRGGEPGFVRVEGDRVLLIPDYAGNNHFNTVGNLVMDPRAGLLFVDFESGGMLQLTGRTEIDWDSPAVAEFPGARRLVRFTLEQAIVLDAALPLRWDASAASVRSLRLIEKKRESEDVVSFVFAARDGGPLADFEGGQHLPIELEPPGAEPLRRTYSLSNGPGEERYRISVKREPKGAASRYLHDAVEVGAFVNARVPAGAFVLDHGERPVVLVSAGIGVTPMLSMLHVLVARGEKRPVWFVHGARYGRHHALADEVRDLATRSPAVDLHVAYSRPAAEDREGHDFHSEGRVDGGLLASILPDLDAEFYLCGPMAFMADVQADLESRGVSPDRIHSESFGPVG